MTVAPADAPSADGYLRPLDGLRGAAVTLVVAYHASYLTAGWGPRILPGGFVGVDLFFVLSGFLITRKLASDLARHQRIDLADFARRRMRRLVPALFVTVVAAVALRALWPSIAPRSLTGEDLTTEVAIRSGIGALLYVSNYQQAWGRPFVPELSHTWSLSIEGQYYLLWPFVLLALHRLRASRPVQVGILVAIMVAVWVHRANLWTDQANYLPLYVRTDTRVDVLVAGSLLGLLTLWGVLRVGEGRWLRAPALVGIAVLGVVSCFSETGDVHLYRDYGLVAVTLAATALVASVLLDPDWSFHRIWSLEPLHWLGLRSYSLYLWHVPVFLMVASNLGDRPVALKVAVGLGSALALAEASYRFVEQPFRHRRRATA